MKFYYGQDLGSLVTALPSKGQLSSRIPELLNRVRPVSPVGPLFRRSLAVKAKRASAASPERGYGKPPQRTILKSSSGPAQAARASPRHKLAFLPRWWAFSIGQPGEGAYFIAELAAPANG